MTTCAPCIATCARSAWPAGRRPRTSCHSSRRAGRTCSFRCCQFFRRALGEDLAERGAERDYLRAFENPAALQLPVQIGQAVLRYRRVEMVLDVVADVVREERPAQPRRAEVGARC